MAMEREFDHVPRVARAHGMCIVRLDWLKALSTGRPAARSRWCPGAHPPSAQPARLQRPSDPHQPLGPRRQAPG
jgi:hypothetical protein